MRWLVLFCLDRPVAVTALYVLLLTLAGAAWLRLPVALLPDLRYPSLAVWTAYPDVPPERVERAIAERVEEAVSGTPGLVRLTSRSLLGGAVVQLDFGWNTDLDLALLEVREHLDRLGEALPEAADRPIVLRLDPSRRPILVLALRLTGTATGTEAGFVRLKQLGREVVVRRLEQIAGVARVRLSGGFEREITLTMNPDRLASYGIDLRQIEAQLQATNVSLPGGLLRRGPFRYTVEVSGEFSDTEDIAATVVSRPGQPPVRLRDVADVVDGVARRRGLVRLNGQEALVLYVERRPDANTVETAALVRQVQRELEAELPGVTVETVIDESRYIVSALDGLVQALLLGGLIAAGVLLAFLRDRRTVLAVALALPLSIAITLILFDLFGLTFNLISLGGLALGEALLLDNAIVVVENAARLRENGLTVREAALQGTLEVAGAITASTLTNLVVFLPLTLAEGLAGRLFVDQALAMTFSLLASLFVALTAVPLVISRTPPAQARPHPVRPPRWIGWYEQALMWALAHRPVVLLLTAALLLLTAWGGLALPREVAPESDEGRLEVRVTTPSNADLPLVEARVAAIEQALRPLPLTAVLAEVGERDDDYLNLDPRPPYEADLTLLLPPEARADAVLLGLQALPTPGDTRMEARPARPPLDALLLNEEADLYLDLMGDLRAEVTPVVPGLIEALRQRPELANVRPADETHVPAVRLTFLREAMARYGVSGEDLAAMLDAAARGRRATHLRMVNEAIPIVLRTPEIGSVEALLQQQIETATGLLPLSTFLEAAPVSLPAVLLRSGQAPVVRLLADVAPGHDLAAALTSVEAVLGTRLPSPLRAQVGGANDAFRAALLAVGRSLLLSLLLMYLILAAEFESLRQPLVILFAAPLAAVGVVLLLALTGQSINLMSLTGLVVLIGIVDNDAIVKVDFINQRRRAGVPLREAILEAGRDRVRPIVMNTLTVVLGLVPLALGLGQGGNLRAPLALAIAGGLTTATVLSLFVVPVLYSFTGHGFSPLRPSEAPPDL
jgi:HAE1 family hydrophobic/amphiphilic exporter-1